MQQHNQQPMLDGISSAGGLAGGGLCRRCQVERRRDIRVAAALMVATGCAAVGMLLLVMHSPPRWFVAGAAAAALVGAAVWAAESHLTWFGRSNTDQLNFTCGCQPEPQVSLSWPDDTVLLVDVPTVGPDQPLDGEHDGPQVQ